MYSIGLVSCSLQIMCATLPGAFVHIYCIKFLKYFFLSKIAIFSPVWLYIHMNFAINHNQVIFCCYENLGVVSHLNTRHILNVSSWSLIIPIFIFFFLEIWSYGSKTKGNKSRYLPGHVIPAPPHRPGPRPSRKTWASCWPSPESPRLCRKILAATIEQSFVKKFLL